MSDGEFTHGGADGGFPARGEPANKGFLVEMSGDAGRVNSAD